MTPDASGALAPKKSQEAGPDQTAYLVFDVETVPDGELIGRVKYPGQGLGPQEAVARFRQELLDRGRSDFIPPSFCYPVAVCVARVAADFRLQAITSLDAPAFRPCELVRAFWHGLAHYQATLVSFNGRSFDMPVLELAAFRFGTSVPGHFNDRFGRRYRYGTAHLDLHDWLSNHGACPVAGGLDLLSKLLGKPGKMTTTGADVYDLFLARRTDQINDYCMFDVLDTYFVFLRTRVMTAQIDLDTEQDRMAQARQWITSQLERHPHLARYLEHWGNWEPWV